MICGLTMQECLLAFTVMGGMLCSYLLKTMKGNIMNKLLIATFASEDNLKSAQHELLTATIAGFPREKVLVNKEKKEIKVIMPETTRAEVERVLNEHSPLNVTVEDTDD